MEAPQQPLLPFAAGKTPRKLKRGLYVTFEGPECSGKTTQIQLLAQRLAQEGYPVIITKQPGGTEVGAAIRRTVLNPEIRSKFLPKTESLLYWADRYHIYHTVVFPALESGTIVLGDRDFDSSWTFQCYGRGIEPEWMRAIQQTVIGDFKPLKTLVYNIPIKTILERRQARKEREAQSRGEERIGEEDLTFHKNVIRGYEELAAAEPSRFITLDGNKPIATLHEETYELVHKIVEHQEKDEVYDVVDADGVAHGEATWFEVHTKGLLHETSAVLIFDSPKKDRMLLALRSGRVAHHPNTWNHAAGGHVKKGITVEQCAAEELAEELFSNHQPPHIPLHFVTSFILQNDIPNNKELVSVYEGVYAGPFNPDPFEAQEIRWATFAELDAEIAAHPHKFAGSFLAILAQYRAARKI